MTKSRFIHLPPMRFAVRLEQFIARNDDGCWLWPGKLDRNGYGRTTLFRGASPQLVHRLAWEHVNGPIPDGAVVCHRCDTPACFRPDHLFVGTQADNARDMAAKQRGRNQWSGATHCKHGHAFTTDNTYVHPKSGTRHCKACRNARAAACYRRHHPRAA